MIWRMQRCFGAPIALLALILLQQSQVVTCIGAEEFIEEVAISPLPSGHIHAHLHFSLAAPAARHYALLPRAVGQLAAGLPFEDVELSLTQGRWHHGVWGAPVLPAKPVGAELRASFSPAVPAPALPQLWGNLSHALSGLFCASLNFLARPEATALRAIEFGGGGGEGGDGDGADGGALVPRPARANRLHAALPKEALCTENLTPALKLLPCRDQAGVASLLQHRPTVFGAEYHSLRVRIAAERRGDGGGGGGELAAVRLSMSVSLVLRPPPAPGAPLGPHGARPAPKPRTYSDWRLSTLFGAPLRGACPAATRSGALVKLPPQFLPASGEHDAAALLSPPTAAAPPAAPSAAAAASEEGADEEEEDGGNKQQQRQRQAADEREQPRRAAAWATPVFTLTPAPDGVAIGRPAGGSAGENPTAAVFYAYDLRAMLRESARQEQQQQQQQPGGGTQLPPDARAAIEIAQEWAPRAAARAAPARSPEIAVTQHTTGAGFLHGGAVVALAATARDGGFGGGGDSTSSSSSSSGVGGARTVCVSQVFPWYVRVWLHTLALTVDGAPADLDAALVLRHVSPAADRARPLALELCLALPARARTAALSLEFTKAFLHAFEWPPDAHRGFDVPAAVVTYAPGGSGASGSSRGSGSGTRLTWEWRGAYNSSSSSSSSSSDSASPAAASALLADVGAAAGAAAELYAGGLLVPLAPPDFSMPYNVVCLTSTVLAVLLGAALNALLRRPGQELRDAAKGLAAAAAARRAKAARVAAVVVVFGALALRVDEELRGQVWAALAQAGLVAPPPAEGATAAL